jgi:hypothetical protein
MAIKIEYFKEQELYKLTSTETNNLLHESEFITENEVKKYLISRKLWEFMEDTIRINGDFPNGFFINKKMKVGALNGSQFISNIVDEENVDSIMFDKFNEIIDNLKLDFRIIGTEDDIDEDK